MRWTANFLCTVMCNSLYSILIIYTVYSKENTFIAFELMRNNIKTPHWIGLKGNATYLKNWDNGKSAYHAVVKIIYIICNIFI